MPMRNLLPGFMVAALALAGCGSAADDDTAATGEADPYAGHEELSDFTPTPGAEDKEDAFYSRFNKNRVMSENYFLATDLFDADTVQAFLEATPYGGRSWLADEKILQRRAADVIVEVAKGNGFNPIVLLVRMQGEQSLISKTARPTGHRLDYAMGCGCLDGQNCNPAYKGLRNQLECAVKVMVNMHTASMDGTGWWRAGKPHNTLDGITVTPFNHVTAALYAYTPWVSVNSGGNWLFWNILKKFSLHLESQGLVDLSRPDLDDPWVGSVCMDHSDCYLPLGHNDAFCLVYRREGSLPYGFCTLPCEGFCPDLTGRGSTFCVDGGGDGGMCVLKAAASNDWCETIPGTTAQDRDRFIGDSNAAANSAEVCVPPT